MSFKKGQVGNPNGKPKGAKNKRTEQWLEFGEALLGDFAGDVKDILAKQKDADPEKFIDNYAKFIEYFQPKQARIFQNTELEIKNPVNIKIIGVKRKDTEDK